MCSMLIPPRSTWAAQAINRADMARSFLLRYCRAKRSHARRETASYVAMGGMTDLPLVGAAQSGRARLERSYTRLQPVDALVHYRYGGKQRRHVTLREVRRCFTSFMLVSTNASR